jgi:hypothetical protein
MKKSISLILFFAVVVLQTAFAQTGLTGINYQAVARNTNGTVLANQPVKVKISVLGGSASGAVQYEESHSLSTNQLGLFTLQIGKGTPSTGAFATVPWQNANQYLKVELAVGSGSYADLGTTPLMSVPYALFAANSNPGATGPQGLQGPAGPTGSAGPAGVNGTNGTAGAPGVKGDQGIQGLSGTVGLAGANGTDGAPGLKGDKGDKGDQGIQGIAGAIGDQGLAGSTGPIGPAGPQGIPGTIAGATAGGDLSGVYPDPTVVKLQGKAVSNVAPVANQYLKYDGAKWLPAEISGGSAFILPYAGTERSITVPLFSITNTGGTPAIKGRSESDGIGVVAESKEGTAFLAKSTEGNAAQFIIDNVANTRDVIDVGTNGSGGAIRAQSQSKQATIFARNDSEDGTAIAGANDFGAGVKGSTNHSTGVGVLATADGEGVGLVAYSNLGRAASMRIDNADNGHDVLTVTTAGSGVGLNITSKNNAAIRASNASNASAVEGSNGGTGAGVSGYSEIGTAVYAYTPSGVGLQVITQNGKAAKIEISRNDNANTVLDVTTAGAGTGVKSITTKGTAIEGINSSTASGTYAIRGEMSATNGSVSAGVRGENKNLGSNGYGVYGSHAGAGGTGVYGTVPGNGTGVFGESQGVGAGVYATSIDGIGLRAISQNGAAGTFASGTGLAIQTTKGNVEVNGKLNVNDASTGGQAVNVQTTGAAIAGYFVNLSGSTTSPAVSALTFGTGPALIATAFGAPGTSNVAIFKNSPNVSASPPTNVARINNAGVGFFNGGTVNSGADIAEAFDVSGNLTAYEPGDILVISQDKNRAVEKSNGPYSNLVAGVYATKPGVLLTEEHIDTDLTGKVPMGVIGVIPTKVCLEGGAINRGDMLVTSSQAGVAMKADLTKVKVGEVLGKALEPFNEAGIQKIKVLVSIK